MTLGFQCSIGSFQTLLVAAPDERRRRQGRVLRFLKILKFLYFDRQVIMELPAGASARYRTSVAR